jgi:hypothetical protein
MGVERSPKTQGAQSKQAKQTSSIIAFTLLGAAFACC